MHTNNWRLWATDLTDTVLEKPTAQSEVTCWCAMTASGLGRPGFFEASSGTTAAVNKDRYVVILEKLWLIMAENTGLNTDTMWSQQDRAPANASIIALS